MLILSVVTPIQAARLECMAYGMAVSMAVGSGLTGCRQDAEQALGGRGAVAWVSAVFFIGR